MTTTDHAIVAPAVTGDPGTRADAGGFDPGRPPFKTKSGHRVAVRVPFSAGFGGMYGSVLGELHSWSEDGTVEGCCYESYDLVNVDPAAPDPIPQPEGDAPPAHRQVVVEPRCGWPNAWTVEAIGDDGEIYQAVFAGPGAKERAHEYAAAEYGIDPPVAPPAPAQSAGAAAPVGGKYSFRGDTFCNVIAARSWIDVLRERQRQVFTEGWTTKHDDVHQGGELACAAASYAYATTYSDDIRKAKGRPTFWPWDGAAWKPTDRRRDLVKAGALILAEIERLDRIDPPPGVTVPKPDPKPADSAGAAADGEDDAAGLTQADIDHAQALLDDQRGTHQTLTMVRHMLDFVLARRGARPHEPADASARSARGEVAEAVLAEREAGLQIVGDEIVRLHRSFGDPDSEPNRYACEAAIYCLTNVRQAIRARPTPAAVLDRARPAGQGEPRLSANWLAEEMQAAEDEVKRWPQGLRDSIPTPPSAAAAPPAPASRATSATAQDAGPAGVTEAWLKWRDKNLYLDRNRPEALMVAFTGGYAAARARTPDAGKETGR